MDYGLLLFMWDNTLSHTLIQILTLEVNVTKLRRPWMYNFESENGTPSRNQSPDVAYKVSLIFAFQVFKRVIFNGCEHSFIYSISLLGSMSSWSVHLVKIGDYYGILQRNRIWKYKLNINVLIVILRFFIEEISFILFNGTTLCTWRLPSLIS